MPDRTLSFSRSFALSITLHALIGLGIFLAIPDKNFVLKGGQGGEKAFWVGLPGAMTKASNGEKKAAPQIKTAHGKMALTKRETARSENGLAATAVQGANRSEGETIGTGGGDGLASGSVSGNWVSPVWSQIRSKIESSKYYPHLARRQGIEGTSHVRFRIGDQGAPQDIHIESTSGSTLLDEATVVAIKKGAPYPQVNGWVRFPLTYDLSGKES